MIQSVVLYVEPTTVCWCSKCVLSVFCFWLWKMKMTQNHLKPSCCGVPCADTAVVVWWRVSMFRTEPQWSGFVLDESGTTQPVLDQQTQTETPLDATGQTWSQNIKRKHQTDLHMDVSSHSLKRNYSHKTRNRQKDACLCQDVSFSGCICSLVLIAEGWRTLSEKPHYSISLHPRLQRLWWRCGRRWFITCLMEAPLKLRTLNCAGNILQHVMKPGALAASTGFGGALVHAPTADWENIVDHRWSGSRPPRGRWTSNKHTEHPRLILRSAGAVMLR